ncbi:MAG: NADH-quinone oxidoreductase subunit N [Campylobacterales bacterium]|nr:NADH-quinone oxidoreductase subunit N [Campylobacterales bacterium]
MIYELFLILPMMLIVLGALMLMLLSHREAPLNRNMLSVLILALAFGLTLSRLGEAHSVFVFEAIFGRSFIVDSFSTLFDLMILGGAMLTLLINHDYFKSRHYFDGDFFALVLFAVFGMMALSHAHELISAFISLEIASLSIYALVGYNSDNPKSREAMMKYVVLGSLAGALFMLGLALIYGATGSTELGAIAAHIAAHPQDAHTMLIIGGFFVMVTLFFKIGAVPFHAWVVDVYHGAPLPVTMLMASTFKIALFAVILRIYLGDFAALGDFWSLPLQILCVLTLIGGSFLALSQSNIKRMLAGSSVVHAGYMLIALNAITLGNFNASESILFYLMSYFISSVGAFGILSFLAAHEHKQLTFEDFKGFGYSHPYLAAMMSIFMLSLAGFPSTIGFLGKFYIFTGAIEAGQIALAALGIFVAFVSIFYYFRLIATMYFYDTPKTEQHFGFDTTTVLILLMAILSIWGGIGTALLPYLPTPDALIELSRHAITSLD